MSGASNVQPNPSGTWTEPPWCGWIETTGDALLILEAARRGIIPRVTRRLVDSERKMITSGSVFVFDEDESGIKRWTDGFFWSPSRILGNFLLYRETDKRGAGHRGLRSDSAEYTATSQYNVEGVKLEDSSLSRPKGEANRMGVDKNRERVLVGSLTNSYKFKPDGLMKKTFSLTIGGVSQHLISYYKIEDVEHGRLRPPSSIQELASLDISPEYLDKTHFRNPPKVEIGLDGIPRYRGEADEIDLSPRVYPLVATGFPVLAEGRLPSPTSDGGSSGQGKRTKRYDPYSKRTRKSKGAQSPDSSGEQEAQSPLDSPQSSHSYADASMPAVSHYVPYGVTPYTYYQNSGYGATPPYAPSPYTNVTSPTAISPSTASPTSQQGTPPPQTYSPYASSPTGVDQGQPGQPPVYPYYGHPYGHFPGYSGAGWSQYTPYPPPHSQQSAVVSAAASSNAGAQIDEMDAGVESEDGL